MATTDPGWFAGINDKLGAALKGGQQPGMSLAAANEMGSNGIRAAVASGSLRDHTPGAPAPVAAPAPAVAPKPAVAPADPYAGEQRLAPGVSRFNDPSVPGVYAARMADGSLGFSNITGANGQPDFGGGAVNPNGVTARGLRNRMVASSAPTGAWTGDANPVTGAPINMPVQRDTAAHAAMLARMMTGGGNQIGKTTVGADPRANYTYAQNSLHMNPSAQIMAAGINPDAAQAAKDQLVAAINADPDRMNPDVQEANAAALAQLGENVQDVRQRYFGGGNNMLSALGAAGGARSGMNPVQLLNYRAKIAGLRERGQRDAARTQIQQEAQQTRKQQLDRQNALNFQTQYYNIAAKDPAKAALFLQQNEPVVGSDGKYDLTSPKAKAWLGALFDNGRDAARGSLHRYDPADWSRYYSVDNDVNPADLALGAHGRFEGFNSAGGTGGGAYPKTSWTTLPNYGPLWNNMSPALLKAIQQQGLTEAQPTGGASTTGR